MAFLTGVSERRESVAAAESESMRTANGKACGSSARTRTAPPCEAAERAMPRCAGSLTRSARSTGLPRLIESRPVTKAARRPSAGGAFVMRASSVPMAVVVERGRRLSARAGGSVSSRAAIAEAIIEEREPQRATPMICGARAASCERKR
eukprot:4174663-Pleurochrysis_carterae.AAC.1